MSEVTDWSTVRAEVWAGHLRMLAADAAKVEMPFVQMSVGQAQAVAECLDRGPRSYDDGDVVRCVLALTARMAGPGPHTFDDIVRTVLDAAQP